MVLKYYCIYPITFATEENQQAEIEVMIEIQQ